MDQIYKMLNEINQRTTIIEIIVIIAAIMVFALIIYNAKANDENDKITHKLDALRSFTESQKQTEEKHINEEDKSNRENGLKNIRSDNILKRAPKITKSLNY